MAFSEDRVKERSRLWLRSEGWKTKISWGKKRGIDVLAISGNRKWIIEAKGEGSRTQMRLNYFVALLGEILQRMDDPNAKYSVALPYLDRYKKLWDCLPSNAKSRLRITFLLVPKRGRIVELQP